MTCVLFTPPGGPVTGERHCLFSWGSACLWEGTGVLGHTNSASIETTHRGGTEGTAKYCQQNLLTNNQAEGFIAHKF